MTIFSEIKIDFVEKKSAGLENLEASIASLEALCDGVGVKNEGGQAC